MLPCWDAVGRLFPPGRFKIKALELNKKILEGAEELRKPPVKEPTVPQGFELELERRLQQRQATKKSEDEEKPHNFKANPLPKKVLDGVVVSGVEGHWGARSFPQQGDVMSLCGQGLPEKKVLHPTVPESPAFALKKRIRVERKAEEVRKLELSFQPASLQLTHGPFLTCCFR